jgi:hypothetical protein
MTVLAQDEKARRSERSNAQERPGTDAELPVCTTGMCQTWSSVRLADRSVSIGQLDTRSTGMGHSGSPPESFRRGVVIRS